MVHNHFNHRCLRGYRITFHRSFPCSPRNCSRCDQPIYPEYPAGGNIVPVKYIVSAKMLNTINVFTYLSYSFTLSMLGVVGFRVTFCLHFVHYRV